MSDEHKATPEAEEVVDEAQADDSTRDEQPTETPEVDEESQQLKAQLEKERQAREKAEKAAADLAFKNREQKRREEVSVEDDGEKPLTESQLKEILAKEREATRKELRKSEIDRAAAALASNDLEKDLILEIHRNRSFPEHLSIEEQIEESYVLANKKKIMSENRELKRALSNKGNVSKGSYGVHRDGPAANAPKVSAPDAAEMARVGFKWNGTSRRYEKKLANGQILVMDAKTKQTQLVRA